MNIAQIESNIQKLINSFTQETFIYDLLLAYGLPKASITRLQKGNLNLSKVDGEVSWKKKVFFKEVFEQDLHVTISKLASEIKHEERFVIATDYKTFLAIDTKTQDPPLDIELKDLPKHYDFFLPWAGMEKVQYQNENPADVKAAEKMAKLFDEIKKDNPDDSPKFIHGLNVFLCRLLFCSFAEDTNIFKKNQFTNAIASHTQADGSDLNTYLSKLFEVLNTPKEDRQNLPDQNLLKCLNDFPYVNGGLFREKLQVPIFTRRSRQAIIDNGELDWSVINPDIFGSMMQAVITPEHRGGSGIHYTSVPNIMKVIEPLFLNDLKENFDIIKGIQEKRNELLKRLQTIKISDPACRSDDFSITNKELHKLETETQTKRQKLLDRLWKIKIFDPACGSGNFLITAYKELRRLEMRIFKESDSNLFVSSISLEQFYGIELDDFAHEIAKLSLWLAEHQMNVEFLKEFGCTNPTLPLKEAGNIAQGNACWIDWKIVCPITKESEIYILGNPPYLGSSLQSKDQKKDMAHVFAGVKSFKNLDYIACWFYIASNYIQNSSSSKYAFVSTNSICQGEQVGILWPLILEQKQVIGFAHTSFKWGNNAKGKAAVTCVIVGVKKADSKSNFIYNNSRQIMAVNINPYLIDGRDILINKRNTPLSNLPEMTYGNKAVYGEHLILSTIEKNELLKSNPEAKKYIRKLVGASDFISGNERWCIWIEDNDVEYAKKIEVINQRIQRVKSDRLNSKDSGANKLAERPHQFRDTFTTKKSSILVPLTTSERREYIPIGMIYPEEIASNAASVLYDSPIWIFGVICSNMHMVWVRLVAGRLKTDYRYSSALCYNTFPFPPITVQRKQEITQCVFRILEEREKNSEKTLAQLYDPDKMPEGLREAHRLNDLAVERCYRIKPFESDEERLEFLFNLYEKMISKEKEMECLA